MSYVLLEQLDHIYISVINPQMLKYANKAAVGEQQPDKSEIDIYWKEMDLVYRIPVSYLSINDRDQSVFFNLK